MSIFRAVITLNADERSDGSVYVHSPDVPLFHAVAPNIDGWIESVQPALKRHLEANLDCQVQLERAPSWAESLGSNVPSNLPAYMIAETANSDPSTRNYSSE